MKANLTWSDLYQIGNTDNANRYYPNDPVAIAYIQINGYRSPSRSWPWSYAKPLMTRKFAKWAITHHPKWAQSMGLSS